MKKLEQNATPANERNKDLVKPNLTLVTGTNDQNANSEETPTPKPAVEQKNEEAVIVKIETSISFEKRLEAVETLHRKSETLARFKEKYQEHLQFEFDLNEGADIETEHFATCSMRFTDSKGRTLTVKSGPYLRECHEILKAKYKAVIEQLENEIRWPYTNAA